ncbi:phosphodiesterase [Niveibacterium sp. SC-1]|uniref:phosphodiesterase n=1 Tax=Niveibacterium sp. SC-1 TaxID=3135646 RepID=UPI00311E9C7D
MLIAQISDTHVTRAGVLASGIVDTAAMLADCVAAVRALSTPPDLALLTGDLVDAGAPEEYARLRALLAPLGLPLLAIPGNHDAREPFRDAFGDQPWMPREGFLQFVHEVDSSHGPLRILGLDTLVAGESRGELCETRLDWLEHALAAAPDTAALIALHHPPFLTGLREMDEIGLSGRDAFADIVARHSQVKLILCGHLHRNIQTTVGGCRTATCPSPAHQIALDFRPGSPARFCMEPPGFMLHRWTGEAFVSHTAVVGDYPGPFAF